MNEDIITDYGLNDTEALPDSLLDEIEAISANTFRSTGGVLIEVDNEDDLGYGDKQEVGE